MIIVRTNRFDLCVSYLIHKILGKIAPNPDKETSERPIIKVVDLVTGSQMDPRWSNLIGSSRRYKQF